MQKPGILCEFLKASLQVAGSISTTMLLTIALRLDGSDAPSSLGIMGSGIRNNRECGSGNE